MVPIIPLERGVVSRFDGGANHNIKQKETTMLHSADKIVKQQKSDFFKSGRRARECVQSLSDQVGTSTNNINSTIFDRFAPTNIYRLHQSKVLQGAVL